jgi:hypothetical protein
VDFGNVIPGWKAAAAHWRLKTLQKPAYGTNETPNARGTITG